ncbi:MAG: transcriptional regulator [Nitrososphaerota archaeon]|jgi:predicted DNA-binding transcriptional regulator|nr:transcriptional regulator [Nitrososphaerota archaeon]
MVSKDQAIGGVILVVCVLVAVFYTVITFMTEWFMRNFENITGYFFRITEYQFKVWVVTIPVFIALIAIMFIGAWIGWTMATTPPPKPIEEIATEIEDKKE